MRINCSMTARLPQDPLSSELTLRCNDAAVKAVPPHACSECVCLRVVLSTSARLSGPLTTESTAWTLRRYSTMTLTW